MNALKMTFLMTFLTVVAVKVGKALGGMDGALIAFMIALVGHGINYWFIDKIILRIYGAQEIQPNDLPWLHRLVQDLTCQAKMPMPKFYLLPKRTATVFATGKDEEHAAVAITRDIQMRDEANLQVMLGRELSRLKNRDRLGATITASVAGAFAALVEIGK